MASAGEDSKALKFARILGEILEGIKNGTRFYKITIRGNANGPNIVNIIDVGLGNMRPGSTTPAGMWVLRFDKAHGRVGTPGSAGPHINVNYKLPGSRYTYDPHTALTTGQLQAAESVAKFLKQANKILLPLAVAIDVIRMVGAMVEDWQDGSFKHTAETAGSIAGGWSGGYLGAKAGAVAGTYIYPGIGTVIGGVVGGILGSMAGSRIGSFITGSITDWWQEKPGGGCGVEDVNDNYGLKIDTEKSEISSVCAAIASVSAAAMGAYVSPFMSLGGLLSGVLSGGLIPGLFGAVKRDDDSGSLSMVDIGGRSLQFTLRALNPLSSVMIDMRDLSK